MNSFLVPSTVLAAWDYDPATQLRLLFTDGALYAYEGVPQILVEALLQSPSPGQFFNQRIRAHFPGHRITRLLS